MHLKNYIVKVILYIITVYYGLDLSGGDRVKCDVVIYICIYGIYLQCIRYSDLPDESLERGHRGVMAEFREARGVRDDRVSRANDFVRKKHLTLSTTALRLKPTNPSCYSLRRSFVGRRFFRPMIIVRDATVRSRGAHEVSPAVNNTPHTVFR